MPSNPAQEIEIICPECSNISQNGNFKKQKCFWNSEKDLWHCFLCSKSGKGNPTDKQIEQPRLTVVEPQESFEFSESLLKAYQDELLNSSEAMFYCLMRLGTTFDLGFDLGRNRIVIPCRDEFGRLQGVKYRSLSAHEESKYKFEPGSQQGFYFIRGEDSSQVLICEGEFDCLTAKALGFRGHLLATQTNRISAESIRRLKDLNCKEVYLWPDQDEQGEKLTEILLEAFPRLRIAGVEGVKDLNELLAREVFEPGDLAGCSGRGVRAGEYFNQALKNAKTPLEKESYRVFDRIAETESFLKNKLNTTGWPTGFGLLDEKLGGGLIPYTFAAISAPGKTGKTTFLIQLIYNLIKSNQKVGFISLEMNPTTHIIPSLLSIALQKNIRRVENDELSSVLQEAEASLQYLNNLTFFDRYGVTAAEDIKNWILEQHLQSGVNIFFLDHVGYSLQDIKDAGEHSKLSKTLRSITREYPLYLGAIVQPKQLPFGQKAVTKHDLYGSVTWAQDLNELMTLERSGDDQLKLRVADSHNVLAKTGDEAVLLFYDRETCSLSC